MTHKPLNRVRQDVSAPRTKGAIFMQLTRQLYFIRKHVIFFSTIFLLKMSTLPAVLDSLYDILAGIRICWVKSRITQS